MKRNGDVRSLRITLGSFVHWFIEWMNLYIVDLRINETLQAGAVRRPHLPFSRLVGTVSNCADAVRLETAPTGGEGVYLFLD